MAMAQNAATIQWIHFHLFCSALSLERRARQKISHNGLQVSVRESPSRHEFSKPIRTAGPDIGDALHIKDFRTHEDSIYKEVTLRQAHAVISVVLCIIQAARQLQNITAAFASLAARPIGIGGADDRSPLPHHRTSGSAYGGSR